MATRLPRAVGFVPTLWLVACSSAVAGQQQCLPGVVMSGAGGSGSGASEAPPLAPEPVEGIGAQPDPREEADLFVDFGVRMAGDRVRGVLRLRNKGTTARRYVAEPVSPPFELERAASLVLEPGQIGELAWYFRPTAAGAAGLVTRVVSGSASATVRLVGEAFEPALECQPSPLDFGPALLGAKLERTVVCVNRAPYAWSLAVGELFGPDAAVFRVGPVAPVPIRPGASWTLRLSAVPTRAERLLAMLPLAATTGRAVGTVQLAVTGIARVLTCGPALLDFGFVAAGREAHAPLRCVNASAHPVRLTRISLDPSSPPWFDWTPNQVPIVVPPAAGGVEGAFALDVVFAPGRDEAGRRKDGILVIETDDPDSARIDVQMTGFVDGPRLSCTPAELDLGVVAAGLPVTRSFACVNAGYDDPSRADDNLVITAVDTTAPEFTAIVRNGLKPQGYRVGEALTVDVTYSPVDEGLDAAAVRFFSNDVADAGLEPRTVGVVGAGRVLPPCEFEVSPGNLRFGAVEKGSVATLEFGVKNLRTDAECLIQDLRLAPGCDPAFSLPGGPISLTTLHAGERLRVSVQFAPTVERSAPVGCDVLFGITNPAVPRQAVHLTGASYLTCGLTPEALDFGAVQPGCATLDRFLRVYNTCATPLVVDSIEAGEGPSAEFYVRWRPQLPLAIAPGQEVSFSVAYRPEDEGADFGSVLVQLEGEPEPLMVNLRGRGMPDAVQADLFTQEEPKTDVLWVVDNAVTMGPEQAALSANVTSFLEVARNEGGDFRIGVTTWGLSPAGACPGGVGGGEDGRLFPVDRARPRILTPYTPNLEANLAANLSVGACAYQGQGLEATLRALFPPVATTCDDPRHPESNDGNCGFLRDDARLAIIGVTDGYDGSPGSADFYYNALLALKGYRGRHLLQVHALAGDPGRGCTSGADSAGAGDRWSELADRTVVGSFHSICAPDWAETMRQLAAAVFETPTCFSLTSEPEDTNGNWTVNDADGELAVWLDGTSAPSTGTGRTTWEYRPDLIAVCFDPADAPPRGSQVEIRYRSACVSW